MKLGRNRGDRAPLFTAAPAEAAARPVEMPWRVAARLECLELAVERRTDGTTCEQIIETAGRFYAWATNLSDAELSDQPKEN